MRNLEAVQEGLRIVRDALGPLIEKELKLEYHENWWQKGVLDQLTADGKPVNDRPKQGNAGDLDLQLALKLVLVYHWELFSDDLNWGEKQKTLLHAVIAVRNQYEGHVTPNREAELTDVKTRDILEGMVLFTDFFDRKAADKLNLLSEKVRMRVADAEPEEEEEEPILLRKPSRMPGGGRKVLLPGDEEPAMNPPKPKEPPKKKPVLWGDAVRRDPVPFPEEEMPETVPEMEPEKPEEPLPVPERVPEEEPEPVKAPRRPARRSSVPSSPAAGRRLKKAETPAEETKKEEEPFDYVPAFIPTYTPRRERRKAYEVEVRAEAAARGSRTLKVGAAGKDKRSEERRKAPKKRVPVLRIVLIVLLVLLGIAAGIGLVLLDRWLPGVLHR